jgi:hypothetical protein
MRYFISVFFLMMSLLNVSSAGATPITHGTPNQVLLQATPVPISTSTSETSVPARTGPPLSLTLTLLGMCCAFAIFMGVVVLGFVARSPKKKEEDNSDL